VISPSYIFNNSFYLWLSLNPGSQGMYQLSEIHRLWSLLRQSPLSC